MIQPYLDRLPLIAILRGITPEEIPAIGGALVDAGFSIIEVPLNSPAPYDSIARLSDTFGSSTLIGVGTVTTPAQVRDVKAAGGRLIVMPHSDADVIRAAKDEGLVCVPGIATPTEAFAALADGADALKLFPAELLTRHVVSAMRSVLPHGTRMLPVGGITPDAMRAYVSAGACGFGLGSALYKARSTTEDVGRNARAFVSAWHALTPPRPADSNSES